MCPNVEKHDHGGLNAVLSFSKVVTKGLPRACTFRATKRDEPLCNLLGSQGLEKLRNSANEANDNVVVACLPRTIQFVTF